MQHVDVPLRHRAEFGTYRWARVTRRSTGETRPLLLWHTPPAYDFPGVPLALASIVPSTRAPRRIIVKWGPPDTGKTHAVQQEVAAAEQYVYQVHGNNCRFEDIAERYQIVHFENFDSEPPIGNLLDWLYTDRPHWSIVYFTSRHHPATWYPDANPAQRTALVACIHQMEHYTSKTTPDW